MNNLEHLTLCSNALQTLIDNNFLAAEQAPELAALAAEMEPRFLSSGDILMRQGEPGDAMFIVIGGRLQVTVERDGAEIMVGEVGRGEVVGEMALLTAEPRSATVRALRDTRLLRFSKAGFERLLERHPQAMLQMMRTAVDRLRGAIRSPRATQTVSAFAVVPIRPHVQTEAFVQRLQNALAVYGSTLALSAGRCDQLFGRPGAAEITRADPDNHELVEWLSAQEASHHYLIYVADPDWSAWTRRSLRQADRVLLLAPAGSDPDLSDLEKAIQEYHKVVRSELVLIHPSAGAPPQGTAAWLAPRQVHTHHHIALTEQSHYQRLARRLTGRAVGLVLGGGGARGYAHIGVIRALNEAGIPIDLIGGASMGALIAGNLALDLSYEDFYKASEAFGSSDKIFDRTLPLVSFMASRKVTATMRAVFGDRQIEDLWRPFFCVSSNLTRAEPMIHQQGPLWQAVRAGLAIPGIFSPILYNDEILVDGGVMNNLPVDEMRSRLEAGYIIAVNASPRKTRLRRYDFGPSVSGWRVLWGRIIPLVRPLRAPSLMGTLMRANEISSAYRVEHELQGMADLLIQPPLEEFHPLDFSSYPAIIEVGYETAAAQLGTADVADFTDGWQSETI